MSDLAVFVAAALRDRVCVDLLQELEKERQWKRQLLQLQVRGRGGGGGDDHSALVVATGEFDQGERLTIHNNGNTNVWTVKLDQRGGCIPIRYRSSITISQGPQEVVSFENEDCYHCRFHKTDDELAYQSFTCCFPSSQCWVDLKIGPFDENLLVGYENGQIVYLGDFPDTCTITMSRVSLSMERLTPWIKLFCTEHEET
uniref:Uncharacterized protein n=1 Tax=Amphora coffeiformis TaxID=265554 RepID=A0A7S3L4L6_9STRA|mmetsp:Transcript_13807/g.26498  ORF Transcript_13807/g.26498 Transcript_13807/m.26498 type:complete len:200 (+) Transcript_13807:147-746(+)